MTHSDSDEANLLATTPYYSDYTGWWSQNAHSDRFLIAIGYNHVLVIPCDYHMTHSDRCIESIDNNIIYYYYSVYTVW